MTDETAKELIAAIRELAQQIERLRVYLPLSYNQGYVHVQYIPYGPLSGYGGGVAGAG